MFEQDQSVQSLSHVRLFVTPWTSLWQASLSVIIPRVAQTHLHRVSDETLLCWVGDAIQTFCPLLSPPPAFNLSQHQGLFQWVSQSIGASASASLLPMSSQNIQNLFPLGLTGLISLQSKGLARVFFNTTVQKHQFFTTQLPLWSNSHIHTWLLEKP